MEKDSLWPTMLTACFSNDLSYTRRVTYLRVKEFSCELFPVAVRLLKSHMSRIASNLAITVENHQPDREPVFPRALAAQRHAPMPRRRLSQQVGSRIEFTESTRDAGLPARQRIVARS